MFLHARRKWEKLIKVILLFFVLIFIASVFYWWGGSSSKGGQAPPIIAKVGKHRITRNQFAEAVKSTEDRMRMFGMAEGSSSLDMEVIIYEQALADLISNAQLLEAARKQGIKVSGSEVTGEINAQVDATVQQRIKDNKAKFIRDLNRTGQDLDGYKKQLAAAIDKQQMADQLVRLKLQAAVVGQIKVTDLQVKESFDEYEAPYVRVNLGKTGKEMARTTAQQISEQLKAGLSLDQVKDKLAKDNPDVFVVAKPGPQRRGSGALPDEVEKAALAGKVGEVSSPIETPEAFYVVKLTKLESKLPKDFDQRKDFYQKQVEGRLKGQAWEKYQSEVEKIVKVDILDKELAGLWDLRHGKVDEAIASLQGALENASGEVDAPPRIHFLLGQLWETKGNVDQAIQEYDEAIKVSGAAPEVEIRIARLLDNQGKKDIALARYERAAVDAGDSYTIHLQLKDAFTAMGQKDLAQKETQWLQEHESELKNAPFGAF